MNEKYERIAADVLNRAFAVHKVSELEGAALDYWVARANGAADGIVADVVRQVANFSTNWAAGGPIIEREKIGVVPHARQEGMWAVQLSWADEYEAIGQTPLVAAMRYFVKCKFGDEVSGSPVPPGPASQEEPTSQIGPPASGASRARADGSADR